MSGPNVKPRGASVAVVSLSELRTRSVAEPSRNWGGKRSGGNSIIHSINARPAVTNVAKVLASEGKPGTGDGGVSTDEDEPSRYMARKVRTKYHCKLG